jgi:CspA family cold shock protein
MDSDAQVGTVKWFSNAKGYGFITKADGTDVFVHYTGIVGEGFRTLREGDKVSFEVRDSEKGPEAVNVTAAEAGAGASTLGPPESGEPQEAAQ